tara:strand:- start:177 stop:512 length:336 start_codon:yes stop_codon:yes gene_type:complete
MPPFKKYPGEGIRSARNRIGRNRLNSNNSPNRRPVNRPGIGNRLSPLNNIRNKPRPGIQRPGPGIAPPNTPPVRGGRPGIPGVRNPGSGGSRTMRRPTMGNVMRPKNRRGY